MDIPEFVTRLFGITFVSGADAVALGYQLAGTDKRLGGEIGRILGGAERDFSFQSQEAPTRHAIRSTTNVLCEVYLGPTHPVFGIPTPHIAFAAPRGDGRFYTLRVGFRWDHNYPGYICSIVPKLNAHRTFIEGHEQGWGNP